MRKLLAGLALYGALTGAAMASPPKLDWSGTAYVGPATTKYFGAALHHLNFEPTAVMLGLAANRPFLDLGWDTALSGEAQVTQYFFGHRNTSFALGIGIQADDPFGIKGTILSFYSGPSYALDPPHTSIGYSNRLHLSARRKFENYFGLEYAVALTPQADWDLAFRLYHRSGAFGFYTDSNDDGLAIGLGVRHAF